MSAADEERRRFAAELGPQIAQTMRRPPSHGEQLADIWGEGYHAGHEDARAVQATWPEPTRNPYRMPDEEVSNE